MSADGFCCGTPVETDLTGTRSMAEFEGKKVEAHEEEKGWCRRECDENAPGSSAFT